MSEGKTKQTRRERRKGEKPRAINKELAMIATKTNRLKSATEHVR